MKINLLFVIIFSFVFSQKLITEPSDYLLFNSEIKSLKTGEIKEELFIKPFIEKGKSKNKPYNIVNKLNLKSKFVVEPVMAMRASSVGFELYEYESPGLWITPGIKIHSTIPILKTFKSIWAYSWASFYKHSIVDDGYPFDYSPFSIFPNDGQFASTSVTFPYNPDYSSSFHTFSQKNSRLIEFDQSRGGVALLSDSFEFVFGKFNTNLGPFYRGNLSISDNAPPFHQIFIKLKHKKVIFTYFLGSLDSNMPNTISEDSLYVNAWDLSMSDYMDYYFMNNVPSSTLEYNRYIAHHRLDINVNKQFRIGLYEQVIFGGRDIPFYYIIPVLPFWSSQHEGGDLDNLMIGIDFDYIFGQKNNRSNRIYGALFMDEWSPYQTFKDNNRNWFAYQLGYSTNFKIKNKNSLFKIEYSKIDPRAYNHRFIINEPKHFGYELGFWSGRNSDDLIIKWIIMIGNQSYLDVGIEHTRFSNDNSLISLENQYDDVEVDFLSGDINRYRHKQYISYSRLLKYSVFLDVELSSFFTNGIYIDGNNIVEFNNAQYLGLEKKDFYDIQINFRYNIPN